MHVWQLPVVLAVHAQNGIVQDSQMWARFLALLIWVRLPGLHMASLVALIICPSRVWAVLLHVCTSTPCQFCTFSGQGSPMRTYSSALLVSPFCQMRQHYVWALQYPTHSTLSLGRAALCVYTAQWLYIAVFCCTCCINFLVQRPCACVLQHSLLPAGSSRGGRGCAIAALQVSQSTWIEFPLAIQEQEEYKQQHSPVPQVLENSLSSQRALTVPQPFLCSLFLCLLCRSYSIGPQSSLRRNCSTYRCTAIYSWDI